MNIKSMVLLLWLLRIHASCCACTWNETEFTHLKALILSTIRIVWILVDSFNTISQDSLELAFLGTIILIARYYFSEIRPNFFDEKQLWTDIPSGKLTFQKFYFYIVYFPQKGSGPIPEVVQYRANPWPGRSKLLFHGPVAKISLIYKPLNEGRFRY